MNTKSLISKVQNAVSGLLSRGFFHVFGSSVINKLLGFVSGVIVIRILSVTDYGVYSYAYNILNIALLFSGLGAASSIVQLCSEANDQDKIDKIKSFGVTFGLTFDALLSLILLVIALFVPLPVEGSGFLLLLFVLYPIPEFLFEVQGAILRSSLKHKWYSYATNINTILIVGSSIVGACADGSVGLIIGRNLAALLSAVIIFCFTKEPRVSFRAALQLKENDRRDFVKLAIVSAVNNGLSRLTYLLGVFLLGILVKDSSQVALYQAATVIPTALNFVPNSFMTFAYPYFAKHRYDKGWTLINYIRLMAASIVCCGFITAFCLLLSSQIVTLVYGVDYSGATQSFCILMLGFLIGGSLRIVSGQLLVTQRKLIFNMLMGIASTLLIVLLSVMLIPAFGINGAAFAQVIAISFTGLAFTVRYLLAINEIQGASSSKTD